jgi:hypothetical protein
VQAPGVPPVLLLSAELTADGFWVLAYSVAPGRVVTVVTIPWPGLPDADDPAYALLVDQLVRSTP